MTNIFESLKSIDIGITDIQNELKSSFVKPETLVKLSEKLEKIHAFIKQLDCPDQGPFLRSELNKHKDALIHLFGRWQSLFVDAAVTQIAEEAQALSESDQEVSEQLSLLNQQIRDLCIDEALSIENQLMITLARRFIAKALGELQDQEQVIELSDDEKSGATEHLFEIASMLYDGKVQKGLNLLHLLSEEMKTGIFRHFQAVGGDLHALESSDFGCISAHSFKMIQALLTQIKSLVQGIEDSSYPDEETIKALFE